MTMQEKHIASDPVAEHENAFATWTRRLLWVYPVLLLLAGFGYARWDAYQIDGDAVAFMDISDAMLRHNWATVVNGYWNPAYAAVLALGQAVAHPSRWNELQVFYYCNFAIFIAAIAACIYLVSGLLALRAARGLQNKAALPPAALYFFALTTLFVSFMRELSLGKVRSDALLLTLIFLAAGTLTRLLVRLRLSLFALLGLWLGLAYLTKSYALLPSVFLVAALVVYALFSRALRTRLLAGAALTAIIFAALSAPYIVSVSRQLGHLTTGDSARMNYAFFVDDTERWHEWHSAKLGRATAQWQHHEDLLRQNPNIYSYRKHAVGTYPLWFDPAYWTAGLKPKIYIPGHIKRLVRTSALVVRFLLERPETLLFLALLFLTGARFPARFKDAAPFLACAAWGAIMIAIYMPIDLQDRYTSFAFMLILFPVVAMLRYEGASWYRSATTMAAMVLAFAVWGQAVRDIAYVRRMDNVSGIPRGAYDKGMYGAARELEKVGVRPGDAVACIGDQACYVDHYWARLAGTKILTEIETPGTMDVTEFWQHLPDPQGVAQAVKADGAKAIVGYFKPHSSIPAGWQQAGETNFYVYPLL